MSPWKFMVAVGIKHSLFMSFFLKPVKPNPFLQIFQMVSKKKGKKPSNIAD